ncbi:beta-galactosidase [Mucilaginibacter mallensis]|uniref:Arabinogalactan endo-beta-1,4-galactanase n=1 Tax=Mucilaginibacter mallensis TaxID=652787 RepID=A0A1H1P256_MUCMA|nr:glycosyl hydrolase 53 family protein [Mucilaginibacter mallensis]SDS05311.1 beta-galactosidase [Mucilaginibacter mallensis]
MIKNLNSPRYANRKNWIIVLIILICCIIASISNAQGRRARRVTLPGQPIEIQLTPYKTTMLGNGRDTALISVKIIDKDVKEVANAQKLITFHIKGDARIINIHNVNLKETTNNDTVRTVPVTGSCWLVLQAGSSRGIIKLDATADSLYTGSTEIHTVQPGTPHRVTNANYAPRKVQGKILGADISFLPELESKGETFSDNGTPGDAIEILKAHGFNYIRLRIFNEPANSKGYSPGKGFCDLEHTKAMAKRIKAAGMKFLLDFHYSDYWADPQQQNKPAAWVGQDFTTLKKSLYDYTVKVMTELKAQGTTPDMVQVGNEINHGMVWPDGAINNLDSLAQLIYSGVKGVKTVSPSTIIMLHIALGGQNAEARFFLDNMTARKVPFDVIGLSYYPKWHGTPEDLKNNMADLAKRYKQEVMVAEYSQLKQEVNDIAFTAPGNKAVGSFIWEPLSTWEGVFARDGKSNAYLNIYPGIAKEYGVK